MGIINSILLHNETYQIINPENSGEFSYKRYSGTANKNVKPAFSDEGYDVPVNKENSLDEIMKKIQRRFPAAVFSAFIVTVCIGLILTAVSFFLPFIAKVYLFIPAAGGIFIAAFFLFRYFTGHVCLYYFLKGGQKDFYEQLVHHVSHLAFTERLWHINTILPNKNLKNYGGINHIYQRTQARVGKALPYFIRSNIGICNIGYAGCSLYFLPDCILVRQKNRFSYYLYSSLFLYYTEKPSLEKKDPPADARVLGYRWLHPNKNHTRDRRYKYNPRIPLMLFSEFLIYFRHHFQTYLQISDSRLAFSFFSFLARFAAVNLKEKYIEGQKQTDGDKRNKSYNTGKHEAEGIKQSESHHHQYNYNNADDRERNEADGKQDRNEEKPYIGDEENAAEQKQADKATLNALRVLGVLPGAALADIKHNYRLLVKRYHPDLYEKNKNMAKQYAEDKLIEINKAYDHVCKWLSDV